MNRKLSGSVLLAAAMVLGLAASAGAVDGTIEINQAKVLAAGGFPYVISTANTSYRLTGSLTVPSAKDGIDVSVSNVTIDLNGFSIAGSGGPGTIGINGSGQSDLAVENGTVTGFASGLGVQAGPFGIVRNVHADANGVGINVGNNASVEGCTINNSTLGGVSGRGLVCAASCAITGNTVNGNAGDGIDCLGNGCVISGNTANSNTNVGIHCLGSGCAVSGNTVIANEASGIRCAGSGCLISGNTSLNNVDGIFAVNGSTGFGGNVLAGNITPASGGTSLGNNLCNGTIC